jgi:enoyl reductase-like protein
MEPQTTQIETTDATTSEFEVTLLAYYPYTQVVKVNANDVDQAIDLAYENIMKPVKIARIKSDIETHLHPNTQFFNFHFSNPPTHN